MIVSHAGQPDVPVVLGLLNEAARWLESTGTGQWHGGFTHERIARIVAREGTFIAWDGGVPVATITTCPSGDPALWEPRELAEPATYVSKMATARDCAGRGTGAALLRWAVSAADKRGDRWARLDAWRTNTGLHAYYERQGFSHVRTVAAPGRNSGALFQRIATPLPCPFTSAPSLPARAMAPRPAAFLPAGAEVFTSDWRHGVVTKVHGPDWTHQVVPQAWEHAPAYPPVSYTVRLDDGSEVVESDVTEAASVAAARHV